ncbi:MAG: geranylgeranylglyceryl phosphate synthase family protein [Bacteroidetes bacterium]|nr:geranylgeranylglyceryl phosphate synthase family protein [Bacteroidota bacterium]
MKHNTLITKLKTAKEGGQKLYAILVDPDKLSVDATIEKGRMARGEGADLVLIGGSLVLGHDIDRQVDGLRDGFGGAVYLFPGSPVQYSAAADGLLFLSLISGRNADLLIGRHIEIAPRLMRSPQEVVATGYMLMGTGSPTSVQYMSHTQPIPAHKGDIALATAQAAQLLGMGCIYMDAGSGADASIPVATVGQVATGIDIPLIVGGGVRTAAQREALWQAGADMVVMGTVFERAG